MELLLEAQPVAARTGRRWATDALRGARPPRPRDAEQVEPLAGERPANVVVQRPGSGTIGVRAGHDGTAVRVAVRDEGTGLRVTRPGPTAPGRRGVGPGDMPATRWGPDDRGPTRRAVWSVVALDGS